MTIELLQDVEGLGQMCELKSARLSFYMRLHTPS